MLEVVVICSTALDPLTATESTGDGVRRVWRSPSSFQVRTLMGRPGTLARCGR